MLDRDTSLSNGQQYVADTNLTTPSTARSAFDNFSNSFMAPLAQVALLTAPKDSDEVSAIRAARDSLELENEAPGISTAQSYANSAASLIGFAANPITWVGGAAGSLVGRGISEGASAFVGLSEGATLAQKPLSSVIGSTLGEKYFADKTIGGMADKTLKAFSVGAGSTLPSAVIDNYNFDTKHIEWGGVANELGEMGAFAIGIDSIPFALGMIKGKVNRAVEENPGNELTKQKMDDALKNNVITPEQHKWWTDYQELKNNPGDAKAMQDLKQRGTQIVNESGEYANASTNQVPFEMISSKDMDSLKSAASDQLTSDLPDPYKTSLSDFVAHNSLDNVRDNQQMLDGVRGYSDHIREKLETKPEKIADADTILDKHLMSKVNENMPFSQKEIMKMVKQAGFDKSHIDHMPLTLPENVKKIIKLDSRIKELKTKSANKQTARRIGDLEKQKPSVMTPKEELQHLRNKLTNRESTERVSKMPEYQRLSELAQVWKNAKSLLDRVHLEEQYKKQEAFKNMVDEILKLSDSDMGKIGDVDNVIDYLNERLKSKVLRREPVEEFKEQVDNLRTVPADSEKVLAAQVGDASKIEGGELNKELRIAANRFDEFKKSPGVLQKFMDCMLGGASG